MYNPKWHRFHNGSGAKCLKPGKFGRHLLRKRVITAARSPAFAASASASCSGGMSATWSRRARTATSASTCPRRSWRSRSSRSCAAREKLLPTENPPRPAVPAKGHGARRASQRNALSPPPSDVHLLTDGKSIYLEDAPNRIIDLLKNARQPMFLVSVTDQVRRLTATERKPARSEAGSTSRRARAV